MDASKLPQAQRETYEHLLAIGPNQSPPTIQELADLAGISSPSSIQARLAALRAKGFVTWQEGRARTIQAIRPGQVWMSVPEGAIEVVNFAVKEYLQGAEAEDAI